MKIGCVLMAAVLGRRFGENKLTVDLGCGETLINYALSAIPGDKLHRVVVVTQYPQVAALAEKYSFTPLHNPYPERGQSESIRIGLTALADCDAVMFQVADQPRLQKETVADLIGFAAAHPDRIVGLGHSGRRVPERFSDRYVLMSVVQSFTFRCALRENLRKIIENSMINGTKQSTISVSS